MTPRTVVHFTDSAGYGGAEQAILQLLAGLDRDRWRPVLMHHAEPGLAPLLKRAAALEVRLCPVPPLPLGRQGAARLPGFVRRLRAEGPAVFHAHLTWPLACKYALLGAVLARVPALVATSQLFVELPYDRSTRMQLRLLAEALGCHIAVSQATARQLRRAFHIPARKIRVVPNAVQLDSFDRPRYQALTDRPGPAGDRPVVLTVARLDGQKGLKYLLEAAALVPGAQFVLVGEGPERAELEAMVGELGLGERVRFLGYREDIPELLASCDLFVLPSLYEGLPLSVLEAMAAGRPVIATAIGGTDEIITNGHTGLLVPAASATALARAIRLLLANPTLAGHLALSGRAWVRERFSAARMARSVEAIYDQLLARHCRPHEQN